MSQELGVTRCVICKVPSFMRCVRCQSVYYCNKEHQRQDWKRHKGECKKLLKNIESNSSGPSTNQVADVPRQPEEAGSAELSEKGIPAPTKSAEGTCIKKSATQRKSDILERGIKNVSDSLNKCVSEPNVEKNAKQYTGSDAITYEGSSENEILSACTQVLSSTEYGGTSVTTANVLKTINRATEETKMPALPVSQPPRTHKEYPEAMLKGNMAPFCHNKNTFFMDSSDPHYDICQRVIRDMTAYGLCVLDNFLGNDRGLFVLKEVLDMYRSGIFQAGQLVSQGRSTEAQTIRSDRITWIDGKEPHCLYIGHLIQQIDNIILRANKMPNNGKMGDYTINGRTKAMVACYPGSGSHYVKHVDNPNKDGRCITSIYYLNQDWDVKNSGGLLRVFPDGYQHQVADIAPVFDRLLFFWSDRRNPHEVQPAFHTRYAITLWYFDAVEREEATRRYRSGKNDSGSLPSTSH